MRDQVTRDGALAFDDVGSGRPVVLLHAFPLSRAMWRPQLDALQADYRVLAPDLRGFGGSVGFPDAPGVDRLADDAAALLDELGIREPAVVGGLSMGGYVALAFARRHAGRLRGLILADTRAEADDAEGRANRDKLIAFARDHTARDVAEQMLPKLIGPEAAAHRPQVADEVRRIASEQSPAGVVGALKALRDRPDATPGLAAIRVPTLVLVGRDDAITPRAAAEAMAQRIPRATLAEIPGAGHLSNLERPERFNAAVRAFLHDLP
jgi:pimeloyl-ACP methyl ester carboxylesterase